MGPPAESGVARAGGVGARGADTGDVRVANEPVAGGRAESRPMAGPAAGGAGVAAAGREAAENGMDGSANDGTETADGCVTERLAGDLGADAVGRLSSGTPSYAGPGSSYGATTGRRAVSARGWGARPGAGEISRPTSVWTGAGNDAGELIGAAGRGSSARRRRPGVGAEARTPRPLSPGG
jgi:hypothetical protein